VGFRQDVLQPALNDLMIRGERLRGTPFVRLASERRHVLVSPRQLAFLTDRRSL
jgi:hypothetical protein